jgi:hypothetical protein
MQKKQAKWFMRIQIYEPGHNEIFELWLTELEEGLWSLIDEEMEKEDSACSGPESSDDAGDFAHTERLELSQAIS